MTSPEPQNGACRAARGLRLVKWVPLASARCACVSPLPTSRTNQPRESVQASERAQRGHFAFWPLGGLPVLPTFGARFGATLRSSDASEVLTRRFYTGTCRGLTVESGRELTTTQARTPTTPVAVLAPTATGRPVPVRQSCFDFALVASTTASVRAAAAVLLPLAPKVA